MAVVIRLMRAGAKKRPFYRMVAADSRRQRDGRFIEILGHYDPIATPHTLVIEKERVQDWLAKGARPSEQVASLLRSQGMTIGKPASVPKKKKAKKAKAEAGAAGAAKQARAAARKKAVKAASPRKTERKAARKAAKKKAAKKKAAKK
jgi:small subunit ribosomal protein S16